MTVQAHDSANCPHKQQRNEREREIARAKADAALLPVPAPPALAPVDAQLAADDEDDYDLIPIDGVFIRVGDLYGAERLVAPSTHVPLTSSFSSSLSTQGVFFVADTASDHVSGFTDESTNWVPVQLADCREFSIHDRLPSVVAERVEVKSGTELPAVQATASGRRVNTSLCYTYDVIGQGESRRIGVTNADAHTSGALTLEVDEDYVPPSGVPDEASASEQETRPSKKRGRNKSTSSSRGRKGGERTPLNGRDSGPPAGSTESVVTAPPSVPRSTTSRRTQVQEDDDEAEEEWSVQHAPRGRRR